MTEYFPVSPSRVNRIAAAAVPLALAFCFGCGKNSTTGPKPTTTFSIADIDYTKGIYYFLYDPNLDQLQIDNADIRLYLDDYNYSNDQNSIPGRAFMDAGLTGGPTGTYGDPGASDTTSVRGTFTVLFPGVYQDYEILEMYGPNDKVLVLRRQISGEQALAVTYGARRVGQSGTLQIGGQDKVEYDGVTRRYMKLLRPPASRVQPDPSGYYNRDNLFARTRDLELKDFYQLSAQHIDPATFQLTIRRGVALPPVTSILTPSGVVPHLEVLGLDSYDQSSGTPVRGHDGKLDWAYLGPGNGQTFVDFTNGILFLPDPRPFAPRIGAAYRATPGGAPLFPFDQAVSNALFRRDSLVGTASTANGANVAIYDKYVVQRGIDAVYYIDAQFTAAPLLLQHSQQAAVQR